MEILRPVRASEFLELALPLLERDEARNQLPLAIAGTVAEHPEMYDEARFWVAADGGEPVAAALHTPPYGAVLADPASDDASSAVLAAVAEDDPQVPGIVGMVPHIETAARTLAAATADGPNACSPRASMRSERSARSRVRPEWLDRPTTAIATCSADG